MHFEENHIYHIYNRSNSKVFPERENYLFFLNKVHKHIKSCCEILAWSLMPNHFHFLIQANGKSIENLNEKHRSQTQLLSKNWGVLLSSYTQAFNKKVNKRGGLWAHKTTATELNDKSENYPRICFEYIHQNPFQAGLVSRMEDWEFSSYIDYLGKRNGKLVNKDLAFEITNIDREDFEKETSGILKEKDLKNIW